MQFKSAEYITSVFNVADIPKTGYPEIAFAGRSNVGKSTLINKVLNRKNLAQVAKKPGKTKALNYFEIDHKYYFVDFPGYGYARISKKEKNAWGKLIESYLEESRHLKGIVHIIDSRRGLMESDWTLIDFINYIYREINNDINALWVLSKADKLKSKDRTETYKKVLNDLECNPEQLLYFSAIKGQGVTEIRKLIMEILRK